MSDFDKCYEIIGDGIAVMKPKEFRKNPKAQKSIKEMRNLKPRQPPHRAN